MTGVVRFTDRLGRICLPHNMRRLLAIKEDTPLEILLYSGELVLRKFIPGCTNCADRDVVKSVGGVRLCRDCYQALTKSSR